MFGTSLLLAALFYTVNEVAAGSCCCEPLCIKPCPAPEPPSCPPPNCPPPSCPAPQPCPPPPPPPPPPACPPPPPPTPCPPPPPPPPCPPPSCPPAPPPPPCPPPNCPPPPPPPPPPACPPPPPPPPCPSPAPPPAQHDCCFMCSPSTCSVASAGNGAGNGNGGSYAPTSNGGNGGDSNAVVGDSDVAGDSYRRRRYRARSRARARVYKKKMTKFNRRRHKKDTEDAMLLAEQNFDEAAICNSETLKAIMLKNMINDISTSKRRIQKAIEMEFKEKFNVICSRAEFSYVSHTSTFCQASNLGITCYAFRAF